MGAIRCDSFLKLPRVLASASKVKCNSFRSHAVVLLKLLWQYDGTIFTRLHYIYIYWKAKIYHMKLNFR